MLMRILVSALIVLIVAAAFFYFGGQFLVIDQPARADAIVVINGDRSEHRYQRGLELLQAGYAPIMFVDESEDFTLFGHTPVELEKQFLQQNAGPLAGKITVCPMIGFSTLDETRYVERCIKSINATSVLLVTSDYHTRRAYSIFRHQLPQYRWSVAAARDPEVFGPKWWTHREWAKYALTEWSKLLWWECVDRWR